MPGKVKLKSWEFWCGVVQGRPLVESEADPECEGIEQVEVLRLYRTELQARERFPFVAKVRLTIVESGE